LKRNAQSINTSVLNVTSPSATEVKGMKIIDNRKGYKTEDDLLLSGNICEIRESGTSMWVTLDTGYDISFGPADVLKIETLISEMLQKEVLKRMKKEK
jgi:hypothetical protein